MAVYKRGRVWWYRFTWNGTAIRESTKHTNKRVAEQMEAAHKTSLAKGEVGIRDKEPTLTLRQFSDAEFMPYTESRFQNKPRTLEYYKNGVKNILAFAALSDCRLDLITQGLITAFVAKKQGAALQVTSINRQLEVLRRMFKLAAEWNKVEKCLPKVEKLQGERRRDRVLSADEETRYLEATVRVGNGILEGYEKALTGIRAVHRSENPLKPEDPFLLRDVTTILIDAGVRPEECFRLRWENVRDDSIHVPFGKTISARRTIPLTPRAVAQLEMRAASSKNEWVFPAATASGHIEKSTLKKQHSKAFILARVAAFPLYTFRHTCLTRWAEYMDPYTLAYLAGHSDFGTTRRYVHPQAQTIRDAMARAAKAQGGHKNGHSSATLPILASEAIAVNI
ncbi:MAG: tyrosine-type recombinase/integrase [Acidobacteriota bacterium]